jgi:anion-transporting  ArsA/GET3 family ATPase
MTSTPGFTSLLAQKEILIFCGSGGVGKTSTAASAALAAVLETGGKVLVLTIDPAKRLADALGLQGIGNIERRVEDDVLRAAGLNPRGELWVAMLDTKQSWDALVLRHAPDRETANRILENPLYENITARFVQSHDYVAMERLFELHASGKYDCVIVDTPPSRNALDFLDAPSRMADFFGGRLLRWLTLPYRVTGARGARVFSVASKPFTQIADRMLGSAFLQDIAEFFLNFQSMYDGFVERARSVERLLHDPRVGFVVVTTLEPAPLQEARFFCAELHRRDYELGAIVANKTLPESVRGAERAAERCGQESSQLADQLASLGEPFLDLARNERVLRAVAATCERFALLANRESELRRDLDALAPIVLDIPLFGEDISDIEGLLRVSNVMVERA